MNTGDLEVQPVAPSPETPDDGVSPPAAEANGDAATAEKKKLDLDVNITDIGPCKKRVKVVVAQSDVEGFFQKSLLELSKDAAVPGFRKGHAPRRLVQRRFRKQVEGQVKSSIILTCLEQLDTDYNINAISQPNLDIEAIEVPEGAPMVFEFEVEVRPDFEVPEYKGLTVDRPIKEFGDADVDIQVRNFQETHAKLEPKPASEGAELGDVLSARIRFFDGDSQIGEDRTAELRLEPELRLQDGRIPEFGEKLAGIKQGETRDVDLFMGSSSPSVALRGKTIRAEFHVTLVRIHKLPALSVSFLRDQGFESEKDLRDALLAMLKNRFETTKLSLMRRSLLDQLLSKTSIQLPKDLVARQEQATLRRMVLELQQSGQSPRDIRAHEAELRANAHESTLRSLREYFILAEIAKIEDVKFEEADFDAELELMAMKSGESIRRVRARVEREGLADVIATQGLERRAIEKILEYSVFKDVVPEESRSVETIEGTAGVATPEDLAAQAAAEAPPTESSESAVNESAQA